MTKHILDAPGDYCRFPMWNDDHIQGHGHGNRLTVCGKPGYPYCTVHEAIVVYRKYRREQEQQHRPQVCFR